MTLVFVVLQWFISGGGGGAATYWLMEVVPFLIKLHPKTKRIASVVLGFVIGATARAVMVAMQYTPMPVDWQGWVEILFAAGGLAAGVGQVIHGQSKLE